MNGQPVQTTNQSVFRRLTDPLREVGQKLTGTLKSLQLTDEERTEAGIYTGRELSDYGERGRFSKEEEN